MTYWLICLRASTSSSLEMERLEMSAMWILTSLRLSPGAYFDMFRGSCFLPLFQGLVADRSPLWRPGVIDQSPYGNRVAWSTGRHMANSFCNRPVAIWRSVCVTDGRHMAIGLCNRRSPYDFLVVLLSLFRTISVDFKVAEKVFQKLS